MTISIVHSTAQIDLHSHAITQGYLDNIKANDAEMDEGFPIPSWDAEKHIAFMDKAGIQTAVLTMPAPQPFFGNAKASAEVCRKYNEECAAMKACYPGRFLFCAALPLPDVPHALEEARYALEVRLASHRLDPQNIFTDNARRLFGANVPLRTYGDKIVRLAEIEVVPEYLEEYLAYAKEVGETSVKVEPGVLTLFSMQEKDNPCKIYILEIYADKEAYQSHLQTAHFKKYKEGTAKMVKSLKLIDTKPMVGMEMLGH